MCRPTRQRYRGRLIRLGEMSEDDAQPLHRGSGGSTYTRKARATREAPKRGRCGWLRGRPDTQRGTGRALWGGGEAAAVPLKPGSAEGREGVQTARQAQRRSEGPGDWATYQLRTAFRNCRRRCTRKRRQNPGYRFYALYDKISREDILAHAYAQCRSNKGAPGVDRQDFEAVEAYGVERWLGELALALRQETYRPDPIRRVFIPKANGKLRPLGISTLRDRVCMTAAMLVLEPIFEADLPPELLRLPSRAKRPTGGGRGGRAAVSRPSRKLWTPTSRTTSGAFPCRAFEVGSAPDR